MTMENEIDHGLLSEAETIWAQREWSIQHVLIPSMKLFFKPPHSLAENGSFIRVTSTAHLIIPADILNRYEDLIDHPYLPIASSVDHNLHLMCVCFFLG